MARTPIVAGNWKMNLLHGDAIGLATAVRERCGDVEGVETIVCPTYLFLHEVAHVLQGSSVAVGAQNLHWEESGAFTGEVSVTQVAEAARYVIIGHSERRQFFAESDETVNARVRSALAHELLPIMCVGETLAQREAGETDAVLKRQVSEGVRDIGIGAAFIVAYEPVWAIGTGLAADGETAQGAIALIRSTLAEAAGPAASAMRVLYGGSVTGANMAEFMAQPDIDGGLVGGASLKADSFAAIVEATANARR